MESLKVLFFLVVCVYSVSTIRLQRDFSYPVVNDFEVYWNVPTIACQKHGINFDKYTKKYGIIANTGDTFRGDKINILYDPGLFPAMIKDSNGNLKERNGGIPQQGNLTAHLQAFVEVMDKVVPKNFDGVGVIDFEAWRPIFRQNWNEQVVYKQMSRDLERQLHPQWSEKKVNTTAAQHFEEAARIFMEDTLKVARSIRPKAVWGYYAFPYCYNYRVTRDPHCPEGVLKENDRIKWMFDESTAAYPSIYMSSQLNEEEQQKFVIGRLNEAWRMVSKVSTQKVPLVYPYIWFKYHDSGDFLSRSDIYESLETTRKYKMGGAIIWGASENVNTKDKCIALLDYVNKVLGPTVARVKKNNKNKYDEDVEDVERQKRMAWENPLLMFQKMWTEEED